MLIEKIFSAIAPARCIGCDKVGAGLCSSCEGLLELNPSRCYRCHRSSMQSQVCLKCRKSVRLSHVWAICDYSGLAKNMIHILKFERSGYLAKEIAQIMAQTLPIMPVGTIICHVPTASNRTRLRGYDQAELITKDLDKILKLNHKKLFIRTTKMRQVGATRQQRFKQAEMSYKLVKNVNLENKHVLLVDDVLTSGATIETLAQILKKNGAKTVDAVVFAQAID